MQKNCIYCGKEFTAKTNGKKYCSKTCKQYFYNYRCQLRKPADRPYHVQEYRQAFMPIFVKQNLTKENYQNYGKCKNPENYGLDKLLCELNAG